MPAPKKPGKSVSAGVSGPIGYTTDASGRKYPVYHERELRRMHPEVHAEDARQQKITADIARREAANKNPAQAKAIRAAAEKTNPYFKQVRESEERRVVSGRASKK